MAEVTRTKSRDSTASGSSSLKKGEYGYPAGHLGHLTLAQTRAFVQFKKLLKENGLLKEGEAGAPDSHEDVLILRFLRARRFIPNDALKQFAETEKWRETNEIDNLYMNIDGSEYHETWKLYPQWTGRRDKRGLPVYVFEVAPLNAKRMAEYAKSAATTTVLHSKHDHNTVKGSVPPKLYRLFALYENLLNFAMPLCTALRDRPVSRTPISQANNIVDISKVGLKQFWNLRTHMQDASVLATAHYPETLDRIFIVGAPAFFPTVWEWIKRWFDPITVSKIFILSESQALKTLSTFIEPENIPEKYGGKLPFTFGGGPVLDPYITERLKFLNPDSPWPQGPLIWERSVSDHPQHGDEAAPNGDPPEEASASEVWKLIAVGSIGGKERREHIATFTTDPVPPEEKDELIEEEAPDRSIDFATKEVKVNPRTSWHSSMNPPSPTAAKHSDTRLETAEAEAETFSDGKPLEVEEAAAVMERPANLEAAPVDGAAPKDKE